MYVYGGYRNFVFPSISWDGHVEEDLPDPVQETQQ